MKERLVSHVTSVHNVVMLAVLLGAGLTGSMSLPTTPVSDSLAQRQQAGQVVGEQSEVRAAALPIPQPAAYALKVDSYYDTLRKKLNWTPIRYAGNVLQTPDAPSRILLAQSAAQRANLHEVGLSYRDVYGIINAETTWIPRLGASKDGTPNLGLAQFEPATAKAVGLENPADPVEAIHAAAIHLRDAAKWSARRIAGLRLTPEQHALKLREGVSIYYNLSVKGRNRWNGLNTAKLPVETRRHIANARVGAREAAEIESQLQELRTRMQGASTVTAAIQRGG